MLRTIARDAAAKAFSSHGTAAWGPVYRRSRDRAVPADERRYLLAVRRELERLMGLEPRADTATRWASGDPLFTESQDDDLPE